TPRFRLIPVPRYESRPNRRDFALGPGKWPRATPGNKPFMGNSRRALMAAVSLTVNGKPVTADVDPRTLLVQLLRENLRLTGTHVGCDTSQCGACVVHVDGRAVKSCTLLALQVDGADVLTIEGLARDDQLHPMQEAFR